MGDFVNLEYFVDPNSVVRKIWSKSDIILLIFAGASAEFALNKAVDWLYFTGRLPADPLGRLFSTVSYAKAIIFSKHAAAVRTIQAIANIHSKIENKRGSYIPDWAYRDVLFLLIDYSISAYEVLERNLTLSEKEEVFRVFKVVAMRMHIKGLPEDYSEWLKMRQDHLTNNLIYSHFTADLFAQYEKQLGPLRFRILSVAQKLVAPQKVLTILNIRKKFYHRISIFIYKTIRTFKGDKLLIRWVLPKKFRKQLTIL